jgi:hypothetical protein
MPVSTSYSNGTSFYQLFYGTTSLYRPVYSATFYQLVYGTSSYQLVYGTTSLYRLV